MNMPPDELTPVPQALTCPFHEGCMKRLESVRLTTEEHGRHLATVAVEVRDMRQDIADHEQRIRKSELTLARVAVIAGAVAAVGSAALSLVVRLIGG